MVVQYAIQWVDHDLITHSPIVGFLGCFLFLKP